MYTEFLKRSAFKISTGKPIGKRLRGRSLCRWEGNFRIDLKEIRVILGIRLIRLGTGIVRESVRVRHLISGFPTIWSWEFYI